MGREPPRPNVLLILADDMGYSDLGCYGSEIATPSLDRLASRGIRFTQFYNGARCCPTRAALLTGLYAHQAGVGHMVQDRGAPAYRGRLDGRAVTIAEALRPAGYRTAMSGKWHVGEKRPHWPVDRGFDEFFGLVSGASNYFYLEPGRTMARNDQPFRPAGDDFYMTDAITDQAVASLDRNRGTGRPFFLYVAYTAPHWPLHALHRDIARYRGRYRGGWEELRRSRHRRMVELGVVDGRWPLSPPDEKAPEWEEARDPDREDLKMAIYAAQVDRMDQGIGRILAKLEEIGAAENTLVMFLSDNGGCAEVIDQFRNRAPPGWEDSYQSYGVGWANASNTPFRSFKHWVHEGGIATPFIACWPARIKTPGAITHQVAHLIDVLPTCLEAAGAPLAAAAGGSGAPPLEGRSLLPIFDGRERDPHPALFWEHEGNRAVRQGKWKLVARFNGKWELYDLEADRTELTNLAGQHHEKVKELRALHAAWAERCGVLPWEEIRGRLAASGPLTVSEANPRYFTDGARSFTDGGGKAVYLTGAHTWNNLVDMGRGDPPAAFDYPAYLDFLERHHHNFIRLWAWDSTVWDTRANGRLGKDFVHVVSPLPWMRTGPGQALDEKPRFDLTRLDPAYFERLRARVEAAGKRGIYVSVMLFEGWGLMHGNRGRAAKEGWAWRSHPFHPENNVNRLPLKDPAVKADAGGLSGEVHRLDPALNAIQAVYIRKVVDTVNDLENVLYEVINEGGEKEWDWWVVKTIQEHQRGKPRRHPVGITGHGAEKLESMLASPADWISPGRVDGYGEDPPAWEGKKVSLLDTDHIWGVGGDAAWVWKSFLRGHNPIFMDPYDGSVLGEPGDRRWEPVRRAMGRARRLADRVDLLSMTPRPALASTGYCLAHPGREYLVYQPEGERLSVELEAGAYQSEWLRPAGDRTVDGGRIESDGRPKRFQAPFEGDAVLYLRTVRD